MDASPHSLAASCCAPDHSPVAFSLVIPVRNEADNIANLGTEIQRACAALDLCWEVLWVDDGSTDGTRAQLQRLGEPHRILALDQPSGQSAALMAGFRAARGEWIGTLDGDGQNDPADLPRLLDHARHGGFDLVNGVRQQRQDSAMRRLAATIANRVRNLLTNETVTDVGCSARVARRHWLIDLPYFHGMHRFLPTLVRMRGGMRITELPVNHRPRQHGMSKYSIAGRALSATRDLFGVRWLLARQRVWQARELPTTKDTATVPADALDGVSR